MNNDDFFLHSLINALNGDSQVDQNSPTSTDHKNETSLNPHHQFDPAHPQRKIFTGNFSSTFNTYKSRLGIDMNIYDSYDVKVAYLDSCGNVHRMEQ